MKSHEGDWRYSLADKISKIAAYSVPGRGIFNRSEPLLSDHASSINFTEPLSLPSVQRLRGLSQHGSPVATFLLGLDLTRWDHTEDVVRITTSQLHHLLQTSPGLFNELISKYSLVPMKAVEYFVEYMLRHDIVTLAFHGAFHGRIDVDGFKYDEDDIFSSKCRKIPQYLQIFEEFLLDSATLAHFKKRNLEPNKLLEIAEDAITGKSVIGQMLKSGHEHIPIDWLAYTVRDFSELMRIFNINPQLPFPDIIKHILNGLMSFSDALTNITPINIPAKSEERKPIDELIPTDIVRLINMNHGVRAVYDAKSIFHIYLMHMVLRLFFTGSPWMRAHHRLIYNAFQQRHGSNTAALLVRLLHAPEKELYSEELKDIFPLKDVSPQQLLLPRTLPRLVTSWRYSISPGEFDCENVTFKRVKGSLLECNDRIVPLASLFDELGIMEVIAEVARSQKDYPLSVKQ